MKVYFNFKDDLVFFVQILCKYKHFRGKQCKLLWSYRGPLTPYKKSEKLEKKKKKKKRKKSILGQILAIYLTITGKKNFLTKPAYRNFD